MIEVFNGTVFNAGAQTLVNTVNTVGVMGAGIALEFSLRYPEMFADYKNKCKNHELTVGKVDYYRCANGETIIVNFPTKAHFKYPSRIEWIQKGLDHFISTYEQYNITSVAFPKLGCSNGGLEWSLVEKIMREKLSNLDIQIYFCTDENKEAAGKERDMVDAYNATDKEALSKRVRLTQKQIGALIDAGAIKRFWQISKIPGIGGNTYEQLFKNFYAIKPNASFGYQLSMFDYI